MDGVHLSRSGNREISVLRDLGLERNLCSLQDAKTGRKDDPQYHQDTVPLKTGTNSNSPISKNRSLCRKSGFNFEYSRSTMYS